MGTKKTAALSGLRLGRVLIWVLLVCAALVAALTYYFQIVLGQREYDWQKTRNDAVLMALTASMQAEVKALANRYDDLARDLGLLDWAALDKAARQALMQRIKGHNPQIVELKFIGGHDDLQGFSFAATHLIEMARQNKFPDLAYASADKKGHIALARPVNQEVQFFLTAQTTGLEKAFMSLPLHGSGLQLRQYVDSGDYKVIWQKGRSRGGKPVLVALQGSRWRLAYWPAVENSQPLQAMIWHWLPAVLVILAIAVLLMVVLVVFNKALRKDLIVLINLARDLTSGKRGGHYPVQLAEFRGTVDVILRMEADRKQRQAAASVKKKPTRQPLDLENIDVDDLLFNKQDTAPPMNQVTGQQTGQTLPQANLDASIFRTYDIRGRVGKELTAVTARWIGQAIGSEALSLGQNTVIVGRDGRISGPQITSATIEGLLASGCNVIDIGMVPTPVLYFATHQLPSKSGVMITGSHNPADYNGFKIVIGGDTLSGEKIQNLRQRIETKKFSQGQGQLKKTDVTAAYLEKIVADVRVLRPLKIVLDCGNGVAGGLAPQLYKGLGCEVIPMYCEVDGNFPHHHPDPSQPDNLQELMGTVQLNKADLGLAFDGDGDRLGVVTNDGKIIWPDRQMMLFAKDVLSRNPGAEIVYDVKCSKHLAPVISEAGGVPVMWKTGHSLIKARMKQTGALLAGEMSGHIFFKERWFGFDDALYAGARLLEILSLEQQTPAEIFTTYPDSVNTPELRVDLVEGEHYSFMDKLVAEACFEDAQIITIDGLRVEFSDGWGLVRASNTTPSLVLRFEADNEAALRRIQDQFRALLMKVDASLTVPF